jgi:hypothetical protein
MSAEVEDEYAHDSTQPEEEDKYSNEGSDEEKPQSMEDIRNNIRYLFQYYTSFGDRKNMAYIQSNKVQKLCKEANIIDKKATKKDVDILFLKINKSKPNMYFEEFIKLLYELAVLKYGGDQMDAFKQLLDNCLMKRLEEVGGVTKFKPKDIEYDELVEELFIHVISLAYDIYHSYFTFRIDKIDKATQKELQRCEKFMYEFLRDFEICPKLLSKSKVYALWTYILQCSKEKKGPVYKHATTQLSKSYDIKEENKLFTFAYFLDFLVLIGNSIFIKKGKKVGNAESVMLLLERMEISRGFANFEEKMHRTHSSASSLLPSEAIKNKIVKQKPKKVTVEDEDQKNIEALLTGKKAPFKSGGSSKAIPKEENKLAPKTTKKPRKASDSSKSKKTLAESVDADSEIPECLKPHLKQLKTVFSYYCSYGEPGNTTKLKSSMFQKMLKQAKVIK